MVPTRGNCHFCQFGIFEVTSIVLRSSILIVLNLLNKLKLNDNNIPRNGNFQYQSGGINRLIVDKFKLIMTNPEKEYDLDLDPVETIVQEIWFSSKLHLEQLVRDAKIAQIYEGTNGIQAQDLLIRKVCLDKTGLMENLYQLQMRQGFLR